VMVEICSLVNGVDEGVSIMMAALLRDG